MLSKPDIIRLAACPTCGAFRREQCTFSRVEDPENRRFYAKQSHVARNILARKIAVEGEKELALPPLFL